VASGGLLLLAAQGPLYALALVSSIPQQDEAPPWNREYAPPARRVVQRGIPKGLLEPQSRLALWPGVRADMRKSWRASVDLADAGFRVVTAWTKNRTMAALVQPNPVLFDQTTDLDSRVLCSPSAVQFLHIRYLLLPPDVECEGWTVLPDVLVDGRWLVARAAVADELVRGIRLPDMPEQWRSEPALSGGLDLMTNLQAYPATSLTLGTEYVLLRLSGDARAHDVALVLPVAYDARWRASSGRVEPLGGLLALTGADEDEVRLQFHPDIVLRLRAAGMAAAQVVGLVGFVVLAVAGWPRAARARRVL
jgi:hypothetical protein